MKPEIPTCGCPRCQQPGDHAQRPVERVLLAPTDLVEPETAGNPTGEQKWVRSSLRQLSTRLAEVGHVVSPPTVGRLLWGLDYGLQVNAKKREANSAHPEREAQFAHIDEQRQAFETAGWPIIRVDTPRRRN